jgi:hypothetical protein
MKTIGTTQRRLGKEFGIYTKRPKSKKAYLTRNGKFLAWEPHTIVLEDDGTLLAIDGWGKRTELA